MTAWYKRAWLSPLNETDSSERSSSSAPDLYAAKVRADLRWQPAAATRLLKGRLCPARLDLPNTCPRAHALGVDHLKRGSDFYARSVGSSTALSPRSLNSPNVFAEHTGVDKRRFKRRGGTCSKGVQTPRSGGDWSVFVARQWRWSCLTNSAMRKTHFKTTTTTTTSTQVGAVAHPRRSL